MIQTENLTKRFGDILAVDDLTLELEAGEVFGFLGPNGAGKTTTIRMLTALISPTSGGATVLGWKIGQEDGQIRRRVGILTESPGLYEGLSAERNLAFFARLYEVEDIAQQVERYLRMLGLWDRRAESAGTFSKGMRQKLAIARALLHEPQALFLDEPTSALDPEAAHMVREFIASLKHEGRTIFLCTHNLDEADRLCDRIAVFNTRLLALDTPTALRRQLYERTMVFHLRQVDPRFVERVRSLPFVRTVRSMDDKLLVAVDDPEDNNPTIVRSLVEAGAEIQFVGELRRSLEDIYLKLIKDNEEVGSGNGDRSSG
ncbi:MAG TPA: ABC transporter ATP-binding protein [Anaerolineae bacterium]|nr:ABC transporter ATP-binding protein [Anaerolineae bacterium]